MTVYVYQVLNPTEQNLKLHNEIDALNGMLAKVSKELNKLQAENQQLQTINFVSYFLWKINLSYPEFDE